MHVCILAVYETKLNDPKLTKKYYIITPTVFARIEISKAME